MKTINCRDDSLIEDRGMWTTMKKKKRCIIVAQGFYVAEEGQPEDTALH
jgi:putative SOS response-associated peptidase YedK